MSADPLAIFYTWPIKVQRKVEGGQTARGATFEPEVTIMSKIRMVSQLVTDADGDEIVSLATVTMAADTPPIPVDSIATLPDELGGTSTPVKISGLHDTKIPGVNLAFYQIVL
ncbi:hypothetical protein [Williamsia soli]|uniref:hypothetical protein n=1 Tax=Williamsia soli TaxID=364929 RepID=UPI001A9F9BC3|nr:hypothetical protein [Williamsia soli]